MGAAWAVPATVSAGAGVYSAAAQVQQGKMSAGYYNYLADTSRINAGLAKVRGEAQAEAIGYQSGQADIAVTRKVAETVGAQKAALAANGEGLNSRTAEDIVSDTLDKGQLDEMAIRKNADFAMRSAMAGADTEAMNAMAQAGGYNLAGVNAQGAARFGATSSLLGAASSVGNSWFMGRLYGSGGYGRAVPQ